MARKWSEPYFVKKSRSLCINGVDSRNYAYINSFGDVYMASQHFNIKGKPVYFYMFQNLQRGWWIYPEHKSECKEEEKEYKTYFDINDRIYDRVIAFLEEFRLELGDELKKREHFANGKELNEIFETFSGNLELFRNMHWNKHTKNRKNCYWGLFYECTKPGCPPYLPWDR